jgi:hypothetical protein
MMLTYRYTFAKKSDSMYMLTTFLGLYGGLKFVVWHVLSIYWKVRKWFANRHRR